MILAATFLVAGLLQRNDLPYPRSARPTGASQIYVVLTAGLEHADQVTLQTLAGAAARDTPRIYTVDSDPASPAKDDTTVFWLRELQSTTKLAFSMRFLRDFEGLLRHLAADGTLAGYVRYGPERSTNAALIRCAAEAGGTIATASNATAALLESLGVKMIANVSASTPLEQFQKAAHGALSSRVAIFQPDDGAKAQCLSDYAVFARAPVVEAPASGQSAEFQAVLQAMDPEKLNAGFGWGGDEHEWTAHLTRAGAVAHASDFFANLAFFTNLPPAPPAPAPPKAAGRTSGAPPTKPVHTVAFLTSDGDNIQILEHRDFMDDDHFRSPKRGQMPLGWSYSPAMTVLAPNMLEWVRCNATANDSLSAGPSGVGYAYPSQFRPAHAAAFGRVTAELMQRAGHRLVSVIGVTPSAESMQPLMEQEQIDGAIYFTFGAERMGYAGLHGNVAYVAGKPVVGARLSLWGDADEGDKVGVDGMVRALKTLPKDPTDPNSYSIVVSELGNGYAELLRAARALEEAGGFEVVLPETLFERLTRLTHRREQCPLPTGPWSTLVGDLPKCSIAGNGSCVLQCEELGHLPLLRPIRCDLSACHNLTFSASAHKFICLDSGSPCSAS